MRTLTEIIAAAADTSQSSPEELRVALLALHGINRQTEAALNDLIIAVDQEADVRRRMQGGEPRAEIARTIGLPASEACRLPDIAKPRAEIARAAREQMRSAMRMSPADWLTTEGSQG